MGKLFEENAKITRTKLTMEAHACLTFWIFVEMKSGGCGFGGYCIGHGYLGADSFSASGRGLEAIMRIMDTVGVSDWEELPGNYVRVRHTGMGGTIKEIGNIIQDEWFNLEDFFAEKTEDKDHE